MRDDLLEWADNYFLSVHGLLKRKTFGSPSYYIGKKLFAFLYEDALGIKLDPDLVQQMIAGDPESYAHFNPGDGIMKNWLLIIHPEAPEYDAEVPLIESALAALR